MSAPTTTRVQLCDDCGEWTTADRCLPCRQPGTAADWPYPLRVLTVPGPDDPGAGPLLPGALVVGTAAYTGRRRTR